MNRTRALLAAGGISIVLVATSVGFAYSNGAFGSPAVDRVGSFEAMQAHLVPSTSTSTSHPANAAAPSTESSTSRATTSTTSKRPPSLSSSPRVIVSTSLPGNESHQGSSVAPTSDPVEPTREPTTTAGRPTKSTPGPNVSTTSQPKRHDDINDPPEDPGRDD